MFIALARAKADWHEGLQQLVPFWKEALEMVIDVEPGKLSPVLAVVLWD